MKCWHCGSELIWGGDDDFDEEDGEGIISNFSCSQCPTTVFVSLDLSTSEHTEEQGSGNDEE